VHEGTKLDERALLEALRASEARFRAICEAAPLGIYVSEIGTGVVYVNPAMERILGRSGAELLGTGWQEFLHPDDAAQALGERASHYEQASHMRIPARYVRSDGATIWTQLHAAPVREGGELRGYVGVLEDVSEPRALQAQLMMAGRLASVGTLAAGVAHEVNTPLAVMLGNLEWVQDRLSAAIAALERPRDPSQRSDAPRVEDLRALRSPLADAQDAARRVSVVMKDLTLFSRPAQDERASTELGRVLASAARMASHELKHRARLVHDYAQLPWVRGSEARLGQVFLNLLVNAAHAIPEGAAEANEVRLRVRPAEPGMIAVEVSDTGAGIAPDVIEHVFDPFFTTKHKSLGTGLGLAICQRIVAGVGGRIEVESQPGQGTVFRVLLAAAAPDPRATPPAGMPAAVTAAPAPRRARVLIIDDDAQILGSIARLLADEHDVETTTSAREALAQLQAGARYDVVLCDLMMPDMDGMAFHERLSEELPELVERVVFITGGAVTSTTREFLDRVPNERLDKPFSWAALASLITRRIGDA